ncbi:MAG: formylglycine-generating enzyme family protein [Nitrospirales bacterium]
MEGRFKLIFLVAVLFMTGLPLLGILRGTDSPPTLPDDDLEALPPSSVLQPSRSIESQEPGTGEDMVEIPAGEFILGSNQGGFNEKPAHAAYLGTYWIDRYEVTYQQYMEFVEATGHRQPGPPSRYARKLEVLRGLHQPVTYVSWSDANEYCRWKGKRLPTEQEWEKAMRGTDGRTWPWGEGLTGHPANFAGEADGFLVTAPVGSFPLDRSVFGVYDGAGNVMEWTDDWYVEGLYSQETTISKVRDQSPSTYKTMRGSGYTSQGVDLRITNRSFMVPDFRDETIGFRCARSN